MDPNQLMNQDDKNKLDARKSRAVMDNGGVGGLKTKYRQSQMLDISNDKKFQTALRNSPFRDQDDISDESSVARSNYSSSTMGYKKKNNQTASVASKDSKDSNFYDAQSDANSPTKQKKVRKVQQV